MSLEKDSRSLCSVSVTSTSFETDSPTIAASDHRSALSIAHNKAEHSATRSTSSVPPRARSAFQNLTRNLSRKHKRFASLFPLEEHVAELRDLDKQVLRTALKVYLQSVESSLTRHRAMQVVMWQIGGGVHDRLVSCVEELSHSEMVSLFSHISEGLPAEWCVFTT